MRSFDRTDFERKQHRGAAAVELAVLLPMLLLIVIGCVDFGRIASVSITLNNAVGAAAEYAASNRFSESTYAEWQERVQDVLEEEMQSLKGFTAGSLVVQVDADADADDSIHVTIEARYPFQTVVDWPGIPHVTVLRQRLTTTQYR